MEYAAVQAGTPLLFAQTGLVRRISQKKNRFPRQTTGRSGSCVSTLLYDCLNFSQMLLNCSLPVAGIAFITSP